MSSARDSILNAVRARTPAPGVHGDIGKAAAALIATPSRYQPQFDQQGNLERFIAKATSERVTASIGRVATVEAVPAEVARYLGDCGLAPSFALQPREELTGLNWTGLETHPGIAADEPAALTIADLAIAETGSVVLRSGLDAPVLMNFLPLHHIVVLHEELIHRHLEDVFGLLGDGPAEQPRNLCIVTGTSGTADIEAVNVRGAHGPRFMHVVIVDKP